GACKIGAEGQRFAHRGDHGGKSVTERDGTQAHAVLDELVPVGVPDVTPLPARDDAGRKFRELVRTFRVGVTTSRYQLFQTSLKRTRPVEIHGLPHGSSPHATQG